ncbi:inositol monophosphatase [Halarchaeum sp. CBA1220]|uniref:inositol monophosphatase family protein n=1 Tax=Halarchaeum sp. CBA1220 TaxID=1853682 RepID=UPI000F3A867F|nr:inositol monophosphatase [Halarchaeum sp. CBA1220]QLC32722.1 inositol monophosphatase [Halarchaeum sp. CBA1220]
MDERARVAETAATAGAEVAIGGFRTEMDVEQKSSKTDVVTTFDKEAQRAVIGVVQESHAGHAIVGEEEDELKEIPDSGACWVIDPIDGTSNFVSGVPLWATSVAAVEDGEPVAAANVLPAVEDVYVTDGESVTLNGAPVSVSDLTDPETFTVAPTLRWSRAKADRLGELCADIIADFGDLRRFGSAQVTLSMVAAGQIDAAVSAEESHPWDTVAGVALIRAAGGTVTDVHGERWTATSEGLVASNGEAHDELVATARTALEG